VEDEKKSADIEVPKSITYKTKWLCTVFEEWKQNRLVKSCTLEPGSLFTMKNFEEGVQTLDTAITDVCMQSQLLAVEVHSRIRSKQFFWGMLSFPYIVLNYLQTEVPPF